MRKPMKLAELEERREGVNQQLREMGEPEMLEEECIGARLYTGPMCGSHRFHIRLLAAICVLPVAVK